MSLVESYGALVKVRFEAVIAYLSRDRGCRYHSTRTTLSLELHIARDMNPPSTEKVFQIMQI